MKRTTVKERHSRHNAELQTPFDLALRLWKDGSKLKLLREQKGISSVALAKRAGISTKELAQYERPGQMVGNFWLFCDVISRGVIDPSRLDDPGYIDTLAEPDQDDKLHGGKIGGRDDWYEWSGKKYKEFRRWVHRWKIPYLAPDKDGKKRLTRQQIREWFDEYGQLTPRKKETQKTMKRTATA